MSECPDRGIGDHDCVEHGDTWPPTLGFGAREFDAACGAVFGMRTHLDEYTDGDIVRGVIRELDATPGNAPVRPPCPHRIPNAAGELVCCPPIGEQCASCSQYGGAS